MLRDLAGKVRVLSGVAGTADVDGEVRRIGVGEAVPADDAARGEGRCLADL